MVQQTVPSAVFIVLATHNGAAYVAQQIESIRRQSFVDWTLLIRDDGSTDGTREVLDTLAATDRRITVLDDDHTRLGAAGNFGRLMQTAYDCGAEYLFFADQDDVWLPDKLCRQLERMGDAMGRQGKGTPHLVYSDLTVVDEQLQVVHPSFLRHARLYRAEREPWKTLLGRSFVLGCACLVNRPLLEFALPLPDAAVMHDWWVALSAAAIGRIAYLPEPMVLYRRHRGNTSGPAGFWAGFDPRRHSWHQRWQAGTANFFQSIAQAQALRQRIEERRPPLADELLAALDRCCRVFRQTAPGLSGVAELWRLGVPRIDLPRRILYYLCLLILGSRRSH